MSPLKSKSLTRGWATKATALSREAASTLGGCSCAFAACALRPLPIVHQVSLEMRVLPICATGSPRDKL